jgi:RNA polymerase sigma-70 factor (sigma-E family)
MTATDASAPKADAWGDPFVELYRERYTPMVRLAYLLTGDGAAAEELVQDSFVALHGAWDRAANPSAYLRTIVVNRARSWGRRRALERFRREESGPPDHHHLVADEMWDTLQRLSPRQRAAIVLRFYEDLPDAEIAALLHCRPATVRTAIHRGLAALRQELAR